MLFLKVRREARELVRNLVSLMDDGVEVPADFVDEPSVAAAGRHLAPLTQGFHVQICPRRFRVFDRIHLFLNDKEIWLPLLQRIKLRNRIRLQEIRKALFKQ